MCNCKKKRGLPICSKKGEEICDGKLVKFFEDEQHKDCIVLMCNLNLSGK